MLLPHDGGGAASAAVVAAEAAAAAAYCGCFSESLALHIIAPPREWHHIILLPV